jgi:ABC-type transport system involved in multi-copper enzyme maturation permease subunit
MLARVFAIAMNTYREAVRARVLYGLFALALATAVYSLFVATLSLHQEARVVADVGAASVSLYAVLVAIVLGSTSLYRELELKTIFPILSRPLRRWEYLVGRYLGTLATLAVFVAIDAAAVLFLLATQTWDTGLPKLGAAALAMLAVLGLLLWRARYSRVFVVVPWSLALFLVAYLMSASAGAERQLVVAQALLTVSEVAVVAAVATLFSSFSTPFLTAAFTLMLFVVGRSADTLAHVPPKLYGEWMVRFSRTVSWCVPNLQIYVPARALLLGEVDGKPVWPYVGAAAAHAAAWAVVLLVLSAIVFRRRDFQ